MMWKSLWTIIKLVIAVSEIETCSEKSDCDDSEFLEGILNIRGNRLEEH